MNTKLRGRWGEAVAAQYLQKAGYKICGLNYRTRFGEIDIIALNKKFLVFVEVKLRKNANFSQAREAVNWRKIEKIRTTAEIWLSQNPQELQPRFDVIEVYANEGELRAPPRIEHIENAF